LLLLFFQKANKIKTMRTLNKKSQFEQSMEEIVSKDPELVTLEEKDYEELIRIWADAFSEDPLMAWTAGLTSTQQLDDEKKEELKLKIGKFLLGWMNRPILIRKKGIVVGVKKAPGANGGDGGDSSSSSLSLAGAVSVMHGSNNNETTWDFISNILRLGFPPFYTKEKKNYAPHGDKRLESMDVLSKRRHILMKDTNKNYIYIQTIGVPSEHQGKGIGGKLMRAVISVADSLGVPLYLYTESKENESLYQHFGFHTAETLELEAEGTPMKQMIWLMIRNPK